MNRILTSIYDRKLKTYTAWYVRWKDPTSGSIKTITAGRCKSEAQIVESRIREALFRGEEPFPKINYAKPLTLSEIEPLFYESPRFLRVCPNNQKNCRQHLRVLLARYGEIPLKEINPHEILIFYADLKRQSNLIEPFTNTILITVYSEISHAS